MQEAKIAVAETAVGVWADTLNSFHTWLGADEKTLQKPKQYNILDEISNFIFTSKYARYNETLKRRETWNEAVDRVQAMHLRKFKNLPEADKNQIIWAFDTVKNKYAVPSMRSMQFGGAAVEAHNARIFNCAVRHIDSAQAFAEVFYLLLCGCGVGLGIYDRFLARIPKLVDITSIQKYATETHRHVIGDTIEGWADSLGILINSYIQGNQYSGKRIVFDYSQIREKGAKLKTGGGKAPGSAGLRQSHQRIIEVLENCLINNYRDRLRTIDAYDILMHAADAVLSGGVRRAATSVMFDKDDELMMNAKTGNWFEENPQRGRSNNSVLLMRDEVTQSEFEKIAERTKEWGEPGFVFADHPDTLFNPCFEISFIPITKEGECGVQFCNLSSINGTKVVSQADFMDCIEAATIIGTLQASYTDFPYLSKAAKELTEEESLLGVSITAMMDHPEIILHERFQKEGAEFAVNVNKTWADKLGINPAARVTCVKPEGTSTLALGSMASGIHPSHARKMFRRIQMNKNDTVYQFFKTHNPHLCEESVWSSSKVDDVITFPVEVCDTAKVKADLTALEHLNIILKTQRNWVLNGTSPANGKPLSHNVSCTVVCKEDEWKDVIDNIYTNRAFFSAVSLLASSGDKDYAQAPMEAILTQADHMVFDYLQNHYTPVDYTKLIETEDETKVQDTVACAGGICTLI